jgi:hypothetical protein
MYYDFVDSGFSERAYLLETSYGFFFIPEKKNKEKQTVVSYPIYQPKNTQVPISGTLSFGMPMICA